ncbi:hypothetical protein ACFCW7_00035 [Paenibacillus glucanolyticus]|uniref:hypothetical protein n=1 Tax=Paenibacillus glucanolyticus TaxID=59843 RepID=UPI0035DE8E9B
MNNQAKLNTAIDELKYALAATDKEVRDHYINNAIMCIEEAVSDPVPTIKPGDKVISTRNLRLGQGTVIFDPRLKQEPGMEWVLYKDVLLHESVSVLEVVE